ncbi:ammonium transporter [Solimonas variicoloris]|uniref:ammonium transporter n=1 Tax=Solimonas variicoloris TaxID=254408 RepID=UPI000475DDFA|nr:ammonium transporter [Solimonas variicoloris]
MRKLLSAAMLAAVCGLAPAAWAQDTTPAAPAPTAEAAPAPEAAAPAEAAAEAPAEAATAAEAPAEEAAPSVPHCGDQGFDCNKGDTAWMMVSAALVLFMTVPGLALFYAGMTRSKNALSTVMQSFAIFCVIAVLWVVYGYSVAFTVNNPFFGSLDKLFLHGVDASTVGATFSKGQYIPEIVFVAFQLTFAAITVALITGGFAERMKFSAVMIFSVLWFTISYLPMAHMVWLWDGPDAYTSAEAATAAAEHAGFLFQKGALDFAGGTVVHINAGIAALVAAIIVGPRKGLGKSHFAPHSLMMTAIGTGMLWMGWFGFNAGSNLEATGTAGMAFFNTMFGTAVAGVAWAGTEWILKGKPSLLGVCSGIVAGLVAITPAAGFVGPLGAFWICLVAGVVCLLAATKLKAMLGYDDALDAFGVHAVGGIIGAIGTGIFVDPALGGSGVYDYVANAVGAFDMKAQVIAQLWGVGTAIVWSGVSAAVILLVLKFTIGVRASDEAQEEGLDLADHGEKAYNQ